jgi:hypothetical protein
MKKIFFIMLFACIYANVRSQSAVKDGLYIVKGFQKDTSGTHLRSGETLVCFNPDFLEDAPQGAKALVINTREFVPLELGENPVILPQTDKKKKLQLNFSAMASNQLEKFTGSHRMQQATLVVNGQALIVHKIRDKIKDGKMEITGCSDSACEKIYVTLKKDVKK